MNVYPIIYSRTKEQDFIPDFLVKPSGLDYNLAKNYVSNTFLNIESQDNIRYGFFCISGYYILGIGCISKTLANKAGDSDTEYLSDIVGRRCKCFIGIAIKKSDIQNDIIPNVSLQLYWDIYKKYIAKVWFEKSRPQPEEIIVPLNIETKEYKTSEYDPTEKQLFDKTVVLDALENEECVDYYIYKLLNDEVTSFLGYCPIEPSDWDKICYHTVTGDEKLIKRIELRMSSTKPVAEPKSDINTPFISDETKEETHKETTDKTLETIQRYKKTESENSEENNKGGCLFVSAILIAVIIISLIIFLPKN